MVTARQKEKISKAKQDWKEKFNEMRFSLAIVKAAYINLPWYRKIFWRKTRMQKLIKQNEEIISTPEREWKIGKLNFFKEKNSEFHKNYNNYIELFDQKKKIKIKKDGVEQDLTELGKAAFKH